MVFDRDSDDLARESRRVIEAGRELRDVSDRLISAIQTIRRLEDEARRLPIGSPDWERISQEITAEVHGVYLLSTQQEALGAEARSADQTIDGFAPNRDG